MGKPTTTTNSKTTQAPPREAPAGNLPAKAGEQSRHPIVLFREYVEQRMATLEEALPPYIPPRKFVSVVMTALQNKPTLLSCTFPSLWNACVRAAHDGLLPDGREGAIAPFGLNEEGKAKAEIATWMPMIEGIRKKIFETGKVKSWVVNVVYDKDEFDYQEGDEAFLRHRPYVGKESSGGIRAGYSIAKLDNGETVREVMTAYQIMQVKNKSKAKNGPWSDEQALPEMCKKTVARRHYKQLPHSESLDQIFRRMDEVEGFADPEATPIARPEPRRAISSRDMMDEYAGTTIDNDDHDPDTGEVRGASQADAERDRVVRDGNVVKDRDAAGQATSADSAAGGKDAASASKGANADAASGNSNTNTSGTDASPRTAGEGDAPASGDANSGASSSTSQADMDGFEDDGADRPWPPGTKPTDAPEYERYLKTKLATFTRPGDVPAWWNTDEEKQLRADCQTAQHYDRLLGLAVARRKALSTAA